MNTGKPLHDVREGWITEQIITNASDYYEALLVDIAAAEYSIEIATYIFRLDNVGRLVESALIKAASSGVKVRVVVDGIGSSQDSEALARSLSAIDAEVRIYHPLPWYWSSYRWSLEPGYFSGKFSRLLSSLNRRDHRKFCVIDNTVAWCGSFNICADHIGIKEPWRDYGVRLTGPSIGSLVDNFDSVWFLREPTITVTNLRHFLSNNSIRLRWMRNRLLADRIRNARHRVWICNAYFSPSGVVISAIKAARKRNIDVKVIVAGRSDITFFPFLSSTYYADLLKFGVQIYRYQTGILHAKVLLADQQCVMGSTNLNYRSFYHDLESDVVLSSDMAVKQMTQLLQQDMSHSIQVNPDDVSILSKTFWFGWIIRIMRYWM
jgi:cardiolipin synthase